MTTDIGSLITSSPGICGGRPCIAGTGVSVRRVAGWYKLGRSPEEIAEQYGHISVAQVHAALAYYLTNQEAMDAEMVAEEAEADRLEREHRASRSGR
jgi:uncharacterized protein (DUF433 family)